MEWSAEDRGKYLYIELSGQIDSEVIKQRLPELFSYVKNAEISKLLVDGRELSGLYNIIDRYALIKNFVEMYRDYRISLQIVIVLNKAMLLPDRFGDAIARAQGINMMSMDSIEEAYTHLDVEPPDEDNYHN